MFNVVICICLFPQNLHKASDFALSIFNLPGDCCDAVPEHPEDVGHPEHGHALAEGREELASDVPNDGDNDDGDVTPLKVAAHEGDQGDLVHVMLVRHYHGQHGLT